MTSEALTEQQFEKAADAALHALDSALGDLDGMEVSLQLGVLTLEFADGVKYVINSHRAARQIWMAAERAAWHFDYRSQDQKWIASKSGDELWTAVETVLSRKLGRTIALR
jgi:CyaY protein